MDNFPVLSKEQNKELTELKQELKETVEKNQIYRTEIQMRYSVLQDGKQPTNAAKYWQCVREQSAMYDELTRDSFAFRNLMIDLDEAKHNLNVESNEFEKRRLEIKIDELEFNKNTILRIGKDRFREIKLWSKLKKEFDDGSFDNTNVHQFDVQKEAHQIRLENRAVTLTNGSNQAEILNVVGPLATMSEEHKHLLDPTEFKKLNKK
jgi:hypothetical protein|tara:strand:+ start:693 stop:1313 length:621 start_codon:yes stop_codon:yes gene_type:complete